MEATTNGSDRGKRGTKHHLAVTADGLFLAVTIAAANGHDSMPMQPTDGPDRCGRR